MTSTARCDPYRLAASGKAGFAGYGRSGIAEARGRRAATAALRPLDARHDTAKLRHTFGLTLPDWRIGVCRMTAEHLARA